MPTLAGIKISGFTLFSQSGHLANFLEPLTCLQKLFNIAVKSLTPVRTTIHRKKKIDHIISTLDLFPVPRQCFSKPFTDKAVEANFSHYILPNAPTHTVNFGQQVLGKSWLQDSNLGPLSHELTVLTTRPTQRPRSVLLTLNLRGTMVA